MGLLELDSVTDDDWQEVIAGEPEPWGGEGEGLSWQKKSRVLGMCDREDRLIALAGLVLADVRVADTRLQVAGIGGVIVTRAARGQGLGRALIEGVLEIAPALEVDRAMLFCLPKNVGLYAKFGFRLIEETVRVAQPGSIIEMPMDAMWKPLIGDPGWPEGPVQLMGEPF